MLSRTILKHQKEYLMLPDQWLFCQYGSNHYFLTRVSLVRCVFLLEICVIIPSSLVFVVIVGKLVESCCVLFSIMSQAFLAEWSKAVRSGRILNWRGFKSLRMHSFIFLFCGGDHARCDHYNIQENHLEELSSKLIKR